MNDITFVSGITDTLPWGIEIPDLRFFLDPIVSALEIVAVAFIVYGAIVITIFLIKAEKKDVRSAGRKEHGILIQFTSRLLTALQFLIAADIIRTIIVPTFESMIHLSFLVGIRIALAVILNRELEGEKADLGKKNAAKDFDYLTNIRCRPARKPSHFGSWQFSPKDYSDTMVH